MHGIARFFFGLAGPVRGVALVALGLALGGGRASGQIEVPLPQILTEAEQAIGARHPEEAAPLLDLVLERMAGGAALPAGLSADRLRLAAATVHFQSQSYARAETIASGLLNAGGSGAVVAEGRMVLGLALALQEKFAEAVPVFDALETSASHRDRARLYGAIAARQAGQIDVAIAAYERLLSSAPRDAEWADSALVLISLHLQQNDLEAASRGLRLLQGRRELIDNVAGLNSLSLQLGDALLKEADPDGALAAYRQAIPREELLRTQALRSEHLSARMARAQALSRGPVAELDAFRRMQARFDQAKAALTEIEKLPGYDALLYVRVGRAFQGRGDPWEAALAYAEVLSGPAENPERVTAHAGLVQACAEAGRFEKALAALDRFKGEMPGEKQVAGALYGAAVAAQAQGNTSFLLLLLERADETATDSEYREPLLILHAQALLAAGRNGEARQRMELHRETFPRGSFAEEAVYLHAMAGLLEGQARRAVKEIGTYLRDYPDGRFAVDAGYRLAAAWYAMEEYDQSIKQTGMWLKAQSEDHPQRGEVLALEGDSWAGKAALDEAIASYRQALTFPLADELLGYVLDELTRHYQARREFDAAASMWEAFARERPDHPFVINAAYWIGRIRLREGRLDEAIARVAEIAQRYLADPARDGVERLLVELAGMLARPTAARRGAPDDDGANESVDEVRLEGLLLSEELRASPTARARVIFTRGELAALRRDEAGQDACWIKLAEEFRVEELPPGILGRLGDYLLAHGRRMEANVCFERIVLAYGRSIFADFGYVGLGEVALQSGRAEDALGQFNAAIDRAGARFKLREATLGRARALLELGRLDSAQELFEQVAASREWRGEATAESVWTLGEILVRRGGRENLAQAQAHFQRVYLTYRKYTPWVARAYLRSAETFAQLGQRSEASATLREMLRDDRLAVRAEAVEARSRLAEWESGTTGSNGE